MKKTPILALLVVLLSSCSNNAPATDGNVTLKASAVSTTGKTSLTGRMTATASTVIITDFKINIGNIKFETDMEDAMHDKDPSHEDVKLVGPFLMDLLDPNITLSPIITSVNIPNARYEEIKFKFEKSIVAGDLNGKTYMIKGTINNTPFIIWSDKEVELEMDFMDPTKDFTVSSNNLSLVSTID